MTKSFVFGGSIKSTADGAISGWLIRFSDGSNNDLHREYFTKSTDYGELTRNGEMETTVLYHHGLDPTIKQNISVPGKLKMFDEGVWIDSQLDLSDRYQKAVSKILPRLGWSAGSAEHLIKTEKKANGVKEIKSFPLGLDASLTPIPAEPTTIPTMLDMATMKSLQTTGLEGLLEDGVAPVESSMTVDKLVINTKGITIMPENTEPKEPIEGEPKEPVTEPKEPIEGEPTQAMKALNATVLEQSQQLKAFTEILENAKKLKDLGYIAPDSEGNDGHNVKSMGDWLIAVARKNTNRLKFVYGMKSQMEISGDVGGYQVPEEFVPNIFQIMENSSEIISRVMMQPVSAPTGKRPALDQYVTPTAGGGESAMNAGMGVNARAEGGAYTKETATFTMIEWKVSDALSGYVSASRELMQDAVAIEAMLMGLIGQTQRTKTEYFILRGNGANQPLGILNATDVTISVTTATDNIFAYADALAMKARFKSIGGQPAWLIHPGVWPDIGIFETSSGGGVFQANIGASLGNILLGYPIIESEHLPQDDNSGDVILADLSAYALFNLGGMYVDFSEHADFLNGNGVWRFGQRIDGKPLLKSSITLADPQGSYTVSPFVKHND